MVVFAVLTGRTLVLPPRKRWYLLGQKELCIADFFDIHDLNQLVPTLTWEEYTDFKAKHGIPDTDRTLVRLHPMKHVIAYPNAAAVRKSLPAEKVAMFTGPDRQLSDFETPNEYLMDHDEVRAALDDESHLDLRLLGTWHTFFLFADPKRGLALNRLMRNHVHYRERFWKLAAGGVAALGGVGSYVSAHIRRGDFQYTQVKQEAGKLLDNITPLLDRAARKTLYIASDEGNRGFFTPFKEKGYSLYMWSDIKPFLGKVEGGIKDYEVGMVEQIVCAESNLFVGTQYSTFSSYITRVKGYSAGLDNKEIFYSDRRYTGDVEQDGNEKRMDTTNTQLGGGEMFTFREPQNVWVQEDNSVEPQPFAAP